MELATLRAVSDASVAETTSYNTRGQPPAALQGVTLGTEATEHLATASTPSADVTLTRLDQVTNRFITDATANPSPKRDSPKPR